MVCDCATSAPVTNFPTADRRLLRQSRKVCISDLGIHIDSGLTMQTHVKRTVSRCFASLRQLRNPSGADSHTPDVGGRFGPLPTGLRK